MPVRGAVASLRRRDLPDGVTWRPDTGDASEVLTLAQACARISQLVSVSDPRSSEELPLIEADGRVLAVPLISPRDLPPFNNSAVDGFAVSAADLAVAKTLPVVGRIAAGTLDDEPLAAGTTVRILTGARLPPAADTVIMQEDVSVTGMRAAFAAAPRRGANVRLCGEDVRRGAAALPAGRRLRPQDLALAAAVGCETVVVARRLRVALFSTGDELVDRGHEPEPAQRFDSNRIMLAGLLARAGATVSDLGILPDHRATIATALEDAATCHDLILTSGGVSVGEEDHVKAAVAQAGALALWRLAIKPGRPLAMGRIAAVPFVGLPGNPVAAFVTFARVLRPMLAQMAGETFEPTSFGIKAAFSHRKRPGLREYVRVRLERDDRGALIAEKHDVDGSAILTSLTQSHGLAEIAEPVASVEPGDMVSFLPYEGML